MGGLAEPHVVFLQGERPDAGGHVGVGGHFAALLVVLEETVPFALGDTGKIGAHREHSAKRVRHRLRRPAVDHTVEHTIHVQEDYWGRGLGRWLLEALIDRARSAGIHVIMAAVVAANEE